MTLKKILTATALFGALATTTVASADHDDRRRDRSYQTAEQLDVIGSARLNRTRGVATFTITPKMRRDGLQLTTTARYLEIRWVELEYSDGRIERLRGRDLRFAFDDDNRSLLTIQTGRPPGLRVVRVKYNMRQRERAAKLQLVQIHTGDGYTKEEDIYRGDRDDRR